MNHSLDSILETLDAKRRVGHEAFGETMILDGAWQAVWLLAQVVKVQQAQIDDLKRRLDSQSAEDWPDVSGAI